MNQRHPTDLLLANDRLRGHDILPPPEDRADTPKLYDTESVLLSDKLFHHHFFVGSADWWLAELDPIEWTGFGFANLGDPAMAEWGYIDLIELGELTFKAQLATPAGVIAVPAYVERDLYWSPKLAVEVLAGFGR